MANHDVKPMRGLKEARPTNNHERRTMEAIRKESIF